MRISVFLIVLVIGFNSYSQNFEKEMDAFSLSYEQESDGNYLGAIATLKDIYNEDSYEINLRLGWLTYMSGLFTESIPYYQNCIRLKPLSIEAMLGLVYPVSSMGNWTQVEEIYNDILKIDPENSLVLYRLGYIYYGKEDYNTALKYFERVLNYYPFDYDAMLITAWTYLNTGDMRKAKVLFNKVLLYQPNDKSAIEGLGLLQ